jgi:hypothetical protein
MVHPQLSPAWDPGLHIGGHLDTCIGILARVMTSESLSRGQTDFRWLQEAVEFPPVVYLALQLEVLSILM